MSRPIKFRGKTINEGEWIYGMTISHGATELHDEIVSLVNNAALFRRRKQIS